MQKNGFKKDLPVLTPRDLFSWLYYLEVIVRFFSFNLKLIWICEFLKNSLLQINSKLNEKYLMITYNNFMIINYLFFVKYCPPKRMKSNLWQRHGKISNIAR